MVLDMQLFRTEQGIDAIKKSELKRSFHGSEFVTVERIEEVIKQDTKWREYMFERSKFSKTENIIKKIIGVKMKELKNQKKGEVIAAMRVMEKTMKILK